MKKKSQDPRPKSIQEVDVPFKKDDIKIQKLDLPVEQMEINKLLWHFNYPFWEKEGTDDWNLTPWELIKNTEKEQSHNKRIKTVDLSYPLQIIRYKRRWLLLDGLHRLTKAYMEGRKFVLVRKIPKRAIPLIKTGEWKDG